MGTTYDKCTLPKPNVGQYAVYDPLSYAMQGKDITRTPKADLNSPTKCTNISAILEKDLYLNVVHNGVPVTHNGVQVTFRAKK